MDLGWDCQLQILEELDFISLISVAETNDHFSSLVSDILRRKLAKKSIDFSVPLYSGAIKANDVHETGHSFKILNAQLLFKLLDNFGHLIMSLSIHHFSPLESNSIYEYINLYCSETLERIHLGMKVNDFLNEFTRPFKRVKSVSIIGSPDKWTNPKLSFPALFPAVHELNLIIFSIEDASWFDHTFPKLEQISIDTLGSTGDSHETAIENIIRKNRQIRQLHLKNASLKLLKLLADETHIETLTIQRFSNDSNIPGTDYNNIRFDNLKVFKIQNGFDKMPENIGIEQLEEFQTTFSEDGSKWIEFVEKNKNLKQLYVLGHCINDNELYRIAKANPNLCELRGAFYRDVRDETIVNFIKNGIQLKKVHSSRYFDYDFEKGKSFGTTMKVLREEIRNEWNIQELSEDIIFERKNFLANKL